MEEQEEKKLLSPKLDVVFQALFGEVGDERITKGFLEQILKRKIKSIDLNKNPILRRELADEKLGVLDIIAELDKNEICNIELQIANKKDIIERLLFYWSKLYMREIKKGKQYKELKKTIVIVITDFKIESLENVNGYTNWKIMETTEGKRVLTDKLEFCIIQLPDKGSIENEELLDWLYFLENPKSERVVEKMNENKELKEAVDRLTVMSEDEKMQRIADLREKAILDEDAIYRRGLEIGEEKGIEKERKDIARKMLEKNIDIEIISEISGLSKEEIEGLSKDENLD